MSFFPTLGAIWSWPCVLQENPPEVEIQETETEQPMEVVEMPQGEKGEGH